MKILLTSDTHYGITKLKAIRKMLEEGKTEEPDVLIHAGDYCGGRNGHKTLGATVELMREIFPDIPMVSVIGNHDYWCTGKKFKLPMGGHGWKNPDVMTFEENYKKIIDTFEENRIHFLDVHGVYIHDDFPFHKIVGHSGWYNNPNPPTNDEAYLPRGIEGNTNNWLFKKAMDELDKNLSHLDKFYDPDIDTVLFVSHFPVIPGNDYKGGFEQFGGNAGIGKIMQEQYNCGYFLEGHSHKLENGPLKYNCGSDYCNPKYKLLKV